MSAYVLIIWAFFSAGGATVDHVPFDDRGLCEAGAAKINDKNGGAFSSQGFAAICLQRTKQ